MNDLESRGGTLVPTYAQLLERTDAPPGSSWGVFGKDDEIGSINFITPSTVKQAATLITRGACFNLDFPINGFNPPLSPRRGHAKQTIFARHADARDDWLDGYFLQQSSHLDGLRHRRSHEHGFYNGVPDDSVDVGTPYLGINRWAQVGIAGRAVLLDIDRHLGKRNGRLDHEAGESFGVALLQNVALEQGVRFDHGDLLLLRTGWTRFFLEEASDTYRHSLQQGVRSGGLRQSRETLAWLWDHHFAVVASDNVALEALPGADDSPFQTPTDGGLMHQEMIAMLGLALGELWNLEDLAADSAATGNYYAFITVKPLNLIGGVGSPANALAIR
jgi:kynurenine formamidase